MYVYLRCFTRVYIILLLELLYRFVCVEITMHTTDLLPNSGSGLHPGCDTRPPPLEDPVDPPRSTTLGAPFRAAAAGSGFQPPPPQTLPPQPRPLSAGARPLAIGAWEEEPLL